MALHELFTNAVKYGALSNDRGTVTLEWAVNDNQGLNVLWREQDGPPVAAPTRSGFGSLLLERVLKGDLGADVKLDYQPSGLACSISAGLQK